MAQVFQCDLCSEIDPNPLYQVDKRYCTKCNTILHDIERKAYSRVIKALGEEYDQATRNSAQVMRLMEWLYKENEVEFTASFGTQGLDLLIKALEK